MPDLEIFAFAALCALRQISRRLEQGKSITIERDTQAEVREIQRSVDEALCIINKTRDVETGIKGFAAVKNNIRKLAAESPCRIRITMLLGDREICREIEIGSSNADESFAQLEKEWMRVLFTEKIDTFMKQSEETSDAVLRVELMRDAVRTALKGLEYLPDDEELAYKAGSAELRLKYLTS